MARQKKIKSLHSEETKPEAMMTEAATLENLQTELDLARVELEKTKREIEEKKHELKLSARRDIDPEEKKIVERQLATSSKRTALENKIEAQKAFDSEKITGKFINRRAPGMPAKLTYNKYADDPVKWYEFEDGKVYTIPRGFAEQINEYYHTPRFEQHAGEMDPSRPRSQIQHVDTSNKKYAFVPTSF